MKPTIMRYIYTTINKMQQIRLSFVMFKSVLYELFDAFFFPLFLFLIFFKLIYLNKMMLFILFLL